MLIVVNDGWLGHKLILIKLLINLIVVTTREIIIRALQIEPSLFGFDEDVGIEEQQKRYGDFGIYIVPEPPLLRMSFLMKNALSKQLG